MDQLLPIIRRKRRPLLPVEDAPVRVVTPVEDGGLKLEDGVKPNAEASTEGKPNDVAPS